MGTIYSSLASREHYGPQDEAPAPSVQKGDARRPVIQTQHPGRKLTAMYNRFCENGQYQMSRFQQKQNTVSSSRNKQSWSLERECVTKNSRAIPWKRDCVNSLKLHPIRDYDAKHDITVQQHETLKKGNWKRTLRLKLKVHDLMRNEMMIKSPKLKKAWGTHWEPGMWRSRTAPPAGNTWNNREHWKKS